MSEEVTALLEGRATSAERLGPAVGNPGERTTTHYGLFLADLHSAMLMIVQAGGENPPKPIFEAKRNANTTTHSDYKNAPPPPS